VKDVNCPLQYAPFIWSEPKINITKNSLASQAILFPSIISTFQTDEELIATIVFRNEKGIHQV